MNDRGQNDPAGAAGERTPGVKRAYHSPMLTEYGSVEDLVDAGVVGSVGSVPSVTMKPPPSM